MSARTACKPQLGERVVRDFSKAPGCSGEIPKREFPMALTPKLSHILQGL